MSALYYRLISQLEKAREFNKYDEFDRYIGSVLLNTITSFISLPLKQPMSDNVSVVNCSENDIINFRTKYIDPYDDIFIICLRNIYQIIKNYSFMRNNTGNKLKKRNRFNTPSAAGKDSHSNAMLTNITTLLLNRKLPSDNPVLYFNFLESEKVAIETKEDYKNANSSQKRQYRLNSALLFFNELSFKHYFSQFWTYMLSLQISSALQTYILSTISDSIIPHLSNPLVLSDSMSYYFSMGGLTAIFALDALFILMIKHGLEYPDFYNQLYTIISLDVLYTRHRYSLFKLLHVCLTSVRLPAYIVAAFIKKLARLCLASPSPALYFILPFIQLLMSKHPNCICLIHRTKVDLDSQDGSNPRVLSLFNSGIDPYDSSTNDFTKCYAIDSSLWELSLLHKHYLPALASIVDNFSSNYTFIETDTKQILKYDKTFTRIFAHELTRDAPIKRSSIAYVTPSLSLFQDSVLNKVFKL